MQSLRALLSGKRAKSTKSKKYHENSHNERYENTEGEDIIKASIYPQLVGKPASILLCHPAKANPSANRSRGHRPNDASSRYQKTDRVPVKAYGNADPGDFVTCSMYPQMIGMHVSELRRPCPRAEEPEKMYEKRRGGMDYSEMGLELCRQLDEERMARSAEFDRLAADTSDTLTRRTDEVLAWIQSQSIESRPRRDSGYGSDPRWSDAALSSNDRVSKASSSVYSSATSYRPCSLPHDEYRTLVRRQKMDRAREILEPHFKQPGLHRDLAITHGATQIRKTSPIERVQISKVKYAVRKAWTAGIDIEGKEWDFAVYQHSTKLRYCKMSDVDGVPISQDTIDEFVRFFEEKYADEYVRKLPLLPYGKGIQDKSSGSGKDKVATVARVDNGVEMEGLVQRPQLVSRFSWGSDGDEEVDQRRRLAKTKR